MIQPLKHEGHMSQNDFVTRAEMDATITGLNRELSGLNTKMDALLANKYDDARSLGALQQQVTNLAEDVKTQGSALRRMESEAGKIRTGVKDEALKIAWEVIKFLGALVIGYAVSGRFHV